MIPLDIRFHSDREAVIFPDDEPGFEARLTDAVIVTNGTSDPKTGKTRPSVVFRIKKANGGEIGYALTSARIVVTLARMIEAKFPGLMEDAP